MAGGAAASAHITSRGLVSSSMAPPTLGQTGAALTISPGPGVLDNIDIRADGQDMPGQGTYLYFTFTFLNSFNNILDVHMNSPPPSQFELQGSSRMTGGIFRGRAYGNNLNQADFAEEEDALIPIVGKVYLYITAQDSAEWNLATMNRQVIKLEVTNSLRAVLEEIGDRHSPVRRKWQLLNHETLLILLFRQ